MLKEAVKRERERKIEGKRVRTRINKSLDISGYMRLLVIETHRHTALCLPLSFDCLAVKVDSPYYSAILCTYWHLYFCRLPPSLPLLASQISLEELDIQRRERERVWQFGRIKRWIIWRSAPLWLLPANFWKAKLTLILSSYRTCVLSSSFCVFFFGVVVGGALARLLYCLPFFLFLLSLTRAQTNQNPKNQKTRNRSGTVKRLITHTWRGRGPPVHLLLRPDLSFGRRRRRRRPPPHPRPWPVPTRATKTTISRAARQPAGRIWSIPCPPFGRPVTGGAPSIPYEIIMIRQDSGSVSSIAIPAAIIPTEFRPTRRPIIITQEEEIIRTGERRGAAAAAITLDQVVQDPHPISNCSWPDWSRWDHSPAACCSSSSWLPLLYFRYSKHDRHP